MIEKEEINEYPYLANYFKKYPNEIDDFIKYAEIGEQMGRREVIYILIDIYNEYYGKWKQEDEYYGTVKYKKITAGEENYNSICVPYTMIYYLYLLIAEEEKLFFNGSFKKAMNHFNPNAKNNFDDMWERTGFFDHISVMNFPTEAMEFIKKYNGNEKKRAALSFGLWESAGWDDGFFYKVGWKSETGLAVDIYFDDSGFWGAEDCWNRPIIKFKPYKNIINAFRLIPMSISGNPEILFKNPQMDLTDAEVDEIKQYVIQNKEAIMNLCYNHDNEDFDPLNMSSMSIDDNPEFF